MAQGTHSHLNEKTRNTRSNQTKTRLKLTKADIKYLCSVFTIHDTQWHYMSHKGLGKMDSAPCQKHPLAGSILLTSLNFNLLTIFSQLWVSLWYASCTCLLSQAFVFLHGCHHVTATLHSTWLPTNQKHMEDAKVYCQFEPWSWTSEYISS